MFCNKFKKRSLKNLFEIFSCENCHNYFAYEYIYIGNNKINIYFLNDECINDNIKHNMTKLFIKENIVNKEDNFLYLDKKHYEFLFDILPLFCDNNDLYILIN